MAKNKWNEQFSSQPYTYGKEVNSFIKEKSHLFPPSSTIACFAEGEGRNAVYLAKEGHRVTAYDISTVGLAHAQQLATEHEVSITTIEADVTKRPMDSELFDGAIMVFGHVPKEKQKKFIMTMIQALKQGAYLLFEVYSEKQLDYKSGGPNHKDFLYNPSDILTWIEGHKCIHFYYGEATRNEGYRHTGKGHVIQVVVQKQ